MPENILRQLKDLDVIAKRKQQVVQPTVQAIQQAPVVKENWLPNPNTIMYNINGKEMFSTSDKVKDIFKSDIDKMTVMGASQKAIDTILKQKYKIKERGTTYIPDDATQKALIEKANGNQQLLIKRKQGGTINYDISDILKNFVK